MKEVIIPGDWKRLLVKLKGGIAPGIIIVIGGTDTGKSVFSRFLARGFAESGLTALVDADLGQSTVGPPATVGLALGEGRGMALKPVCTRFVGSTSPAGHLLQTLVAVKKLVDRALELKAKRIVIDTSGFISGPLGREFKFQKIDLVSPDHIIALERKGELEELLKNFRKSGNISVHRIKVSAEAGVRSAKERRLYREAKFRQYFDGAKIKALSLDRLGLHGIVPEPLEGKQLKGLLIGLCDGENNTVSLGIIRDVDLTGGTISCITPVGSVSMVKTIQFGSIYLDL